MTSVEPCTGCGRLFQYLPRGLCPECLATRDDQFHTVREWLRTNRASTPGQVADATGVDMELIQDWVRQGRLELASLHTVDAEAERRQAELRDRLKGDLLRAVGNNPSVQPDPSRQGMHTRRP